MAGRRMASWPLLLSSSFCVGHSIVVQLELSIERLRHERHRARTKWIYIFIDKMRWTLNWGYRTAVYLFFFNLLCLQFCRECIFFSFFLCKNREASHRPLLFNATSLFSECGRNIQNKYSIFADPSYLVVDVYLSSTLADGKTNYIYIYIPRTRYMYIFTFS